VLIAVVFSAIATAVATSGSAVRVHDLSSERSSRLDGRLSSVGAVRWVDDRHLFSAGYDGQALLWSVTDNDVRHRFHAGGGACGVPEVEPGALTSGDRWSVMIAACRCGCCT
jgi:WD40 repeat protein